MTAICANVSMPVSPTAAQAIDLTPPPAGTALKHERLDENTRLPWLGDVIPIPGIREVLSIGDLVLALGIAKLIYVRMMSNRRSEPATTGEASG